MKKIVWLIVLYSAAISAKDLGTFGETFPIIEENLISFIQGKLSILQENGDLEQHQQAISKKVVSRIERPTPIEEVFRTKESRQFYYDPSITVPYDLKDHKEVVFHKAGTSINPLETHHLKQPLLFIDGDDLEQVNWAKKEMHSSPKIILTKGAPFGLMKSLDTPVYFDQGGTIVKKLGIKQVPALVIEEDKKLLITEVLLEVKQ